MALLKKLLALITSGGASVVGSLGKKVLIAIVGLALSALRVRYPDLALPSDELIVDIVLALLAAHTLTDVAAVIKVGSKEVVKELAPKL
jgi:hypothetical protein